MYPHVIAVHLENTSKRVVSPPEVTLGKKPRPKSFSDTAPTSPTKDTGVLLDCPICHGRFPELYSHIFLTHTKRGQLDCTFCGKVVPERYQLKNHFIVHTGERPYACEFCGNRFSQKSSRGQHQLYVCRAAKLNDEAAKTKSPLKKNLIPKREHPISPAKNVNRIQKGKSIYTCPVCHLGCSGWYALHKHFVVHTKERPYLCRYCPKDFTTRSSATDHIKRFHHGRPKEGGFRVKKGSIFERRHPWEAMGYFMGPAKVSAAVKPTKPTKLTKPAPPKPEVVAVIAKEKPGNSATGIRRIIKKVRKRLPKCHQCKKTFTHSLQVKLHIKQAHKPRPTHPFECSVCGNTFVSKSNWLHHVNTHVEGRPVACKFCGSLFKKKDSCERHIKIFHSEVEVAEQQQPDRPQVVKTIRIKKEPKDDASSGQRRYTVVSDNDKTHRRFPCQHCDKSYVHSRGLRAHFLSIHKANIERQSSEKEDESTDSGVVAEERPRPKPTRAVTPKTYKCKLCAKSIVGLVLLKRHIKTMHKVKERNHKCKACNAAFSTKGLLRRHSTIHEAIAPYSCCNIRFNQKANYERHVRNYHDSVFDKDE